MSGRGRKHRKATRSRRGKQQGKTPRAWRRPVLLWMVAFAVVAAGYVWLRLQTTAVAFELEEMHRLEQRLTSERADLEVELARLTAPRALNRVARERLGLRPPRAGQVVGIE